jgi:translation initiation factor 4G
MQAPASPGGRNQSKNQRTSSRRAPPPPPPSSEPPVEPLLPSANRWKPQRADVALGPPPGAEATKLTPEVVQRKVKSLLNKLTLEKFDKITDQILEIASQSRHETDGRTLRQIIQLTFEKATDEPTFSEMYATFCRKIMETIDPSITDPAVLNKDGQPLTGGQLFRKYLLNRCQEEFERGWKINLPPKPDENATGKEAELLSDEYYIAAKAKRQGLGLVQFIGELFKLNMLIEKIMYECIIRLLGGTDDPHPEPEEVESLCRLLNTVGKALDEGKAKTRMNAIYEALDYIRLHSDLESRIKFKILVCSLA